MRSQLLLLLSGNGFCAAQFRFGFLVHGRVGQIVVDVDAEQRRRGGVAVGTPDIVGIDRVHPRRVAREAPPTR